MKEVSKKWNQEWNMLFTLLKVDEAFLMKDIPNLLTFCQDNLVMKE